jgi:hypothetical protein
MSYSVEHASVYVINKARACKRGNAVFRLSPLKNAMTILLNSS